MVTMTKVGDQVVTEDYALYLGDCIEVIQEIPDESVGLSVFSPPFASMYSYSDDPRDLCNCKDYEQFLEHFGFLVRHLYRVLLPGRVVAVHCMDLPTFKRDGEEIGIQDFPGDIIRLFEQHRFIYHGRICIWKDPLVAATRTKAIGLAHKQIVKDSALCRTGIADSIVTFRKPGENPRPVCNEQGLTVYHGTRPVPEGLLTNADPRKDKRSHWIWQQYASPVWFDIDQTHVLPFRDAKAPDDMRHICPLQLQVVERCVALWSTPGDVVFSPFMGVGSEVYVAVLRKRKGVGIELKKSYFKQAVLNVKQAVKSRKGGLL